MVLSSLTIGEQKYLFTEQSSEKIESCEIKLSDSDKLMFRENGTNLHL